MNLLLLAYLLSASTFSVTIFFICIPLMIGVPKTLLNKIFIAEIFIALITALITLFYVFMKTESFYFQDTNVFLNLYPKISSTLVPLAIFLQPLFLRASRKPISRRALFFYSLPIINHLMVTATFMLSKIDLQVYVNDQPYAVLFRVAIGFIVPATWFFYESIKISDPKNPLIIKWMIYSSGLGIALAITFFGISVSEVITLSNDSVNLPKVFDSIIQFNIFRGFYYCIFQLLIFLYWYNKYSISAIRLATNRERLNDLLAEKNALILKLSNQSTLIESGALSAGLAHEINQFLARVQLNGDEALHLISQASMKPENLKQPLENILKANHSASKLIMSLKKLFVQSEDDSTLCSVDHLVTDILPLYERYIEKSQIKIVLDLQVTEQQFVRETLFRQVIANLLLNAIEALDSISSVNKVIRIQSKIEQDGDYSLTVTDNGPGIHPDQEAKMFSLFATSKSSGTGVGLWLSRYVAEYHQGSLTFANLPGNSGVSFTIAIPRGVKTKSGIVVPK